MRLAVVTAALGALALAVGNAAASGYIDVHLSIKAIRSPVDGARPAITTDSTQFLTDPVIAAQVARANELLDSYGRGYRFVVDEIVEVGTQCAVCDSANPSFWYDVFVRDNDGMFLFERQAEMHTATFAWRTDKVNIYCNKGMGDGGESSFKDGAGSEDVIFYGARCFDPGYVSTWGGEVFHHELGHYFDLRHTQAQDCKDCPAWCNSVVTDGDLVDDTIADNPCMTLNQLALANFGVPYLSLPPSGQELVDDVYTNNMAYIHQGQTFGQSSMYRLTEGQLDRWTDSANDQRGLVRSGRTVFVEIGSTGYQGTSMDPFGYVQLGLNNAQPGDIVLIRPGTYPENITFTSPVTVRATRNGPARIGN